MKIAIYARVSTMDQSCDMQLKELREYAKRRGFTIYKEYVDTGFSGSKEKRPALNQLGQDAGKHKFDAVLVWKFDRFARSTKHLVTALSEFEARKIAFLSYTENFDTTTPMGRAMFTVIAAMAQLERDVIRERVSAGMRAAKARGVHLGRKAKIDPEDVRELRHQKMSIRNIAKKLGCSKTHVERILKESEPEAK